MKRHFCTVRRFVAHWFNCSVMSWTSSKGNRFNIRFNVFPNVKHRRDANVYNDSLMKSHFWKKEKLCLLKSFVLIHLLMMLIVTRVVDWIFNVFVIVMGKLSMKPIRYSLTWDWLFNWSENWFNVILEL